MRWKQPLLLFLLAGAIRVFTSWRTTPWVLAGIGLALLALARWAPRQATRLEAVTFRLGLFVANGINGFLLAPLYYLAFPLGRWLRHLRRYDPLDKKCPAPEHASFWKTCQPSDPSSYRWQH